jgi:HSP20 family protein
MNLRSLMPIGRKGEFARWNGGPIGDLNREIDRLFDDFTRGLPAFGPSTLTPKMDVTETETEIELTAELPGLEEKDVQINVADGVLTIRGEKKAEKEEKDKDYRLVERSYGAFERSLDLPSGVDPDKIEASIAKGVLTVKVPKPEKAKGKKIDVKPVA